jgi:cytolysin-activating lysine-acyltransferase
MFFGRRSKEKDSQEKKSEAEKNGMAPTSVTAPLAEAQAPDPAKEPTAAPANAVTSASSAALELDHEEAKRSMAAARQVSAMFGEVVRLLMRTPQYKGLSLTDLDWLVVPALLSGQVSVATAQFKTNGAMMPVGVVLWARVSADVDKRLAAQSGEAIRLAPKEWTSGDIVWVAASAGDGRVLSEMLKRLSTKEWAGNEVRIMVRAKDGKPTVATLAARSAEAA